MKKTPAHILPTIVLSQFAGTSLWFAGNAIVPELQEEFQLAAGTMGYITSAVQFGFISGTFVFAFLLIADRFSASKVFMVSSVLAALANLGIYLLAVDLWSILGFRFVTGFFLAGIYPVGMKIASDWYDGKLGIALGYLVGALVLGTAFPHFLRYSASDWPWEYLIIATAILAGLGGVLLYLLVPDGPFQKKATQLDMGVLPKLFRGKAFRSAAFGYFGHMWELYTFWTFVPFIIFSYQGLYSESFPANVSLWSFLVIAMGGLGCIIGGYISLKSGSARVAFGMLLCSGICCLISPFLYSGSAVFLITVLLIWGFSVVGDSPQFSTLVAQTAPSEFRGSALTIVNGIGFAITIFSIELFNYTRSFSEPTFLFWLLLIGPIIGIWSIKGLLNQSTK